MNKITKQRTRNRLEKQKETVSELRAAYADEEGKVNGAWFEIVCYAAFWNAVNNNPEPLNIPDKLFETWKREFVAIAELLLSSGEKSREEKIQAVLDYSKPK